ncbi:hypothetical protein SAMN05216338_1005148 [Bradyrhizobium sp. Rc2d]|uniref:hypothetical protein n=1 Tax=Bradyrhizobium sp. Rc2d TaxID=1855321 RepID=UPI0008832265|nr:hypothetical protein [Bradyrhizobium sp. Rc2d]SDH10203.1 hypothetical protein SAMN05216338_1005148 [Bradyrhizobium sp. Rc2d]
MSHKKSFGVDQRGAVAFETMIVYFFLVAFLLMPLADVAAAGFQFISGWSALRGFGQYIQYSPPPDVTNTSSWASSALAKAGPSFPISNLQVMCGDANAVCNSSNVTSIPKYFTFSTTVTLAPIVLRPILCPTTCTYTLPYSERFQ